MSQNPMLPQHRVAAIRMPPGRTIEHELRLMAQRRVTLRLALASATARQQASPAGPDDDADARRHIARLHRELRLLAEGIRVARQYRTQAEILLRLLKRRHRGSSQRRQLWRELVAQARQVYRAQDCEAILDELDDLLGFAGPQAAWAQTRPAHLPGTRA